MIPLDVWIGMILKLIGAACGAALSLVYLQPATKEEFYRRLIGALVVGVLFSPYIGDWAGFDRNWEGVMAAACFSGFVSWSAMGAVTKIIEAWDWDLIRRLKGKKD